MSDIEFLRQLGEDLRAAARREASPGAAVGSVQSTRSLRWTVLASVALVALVGSALLWRVLASGGGEKVVPQAPNAGNPRVGGGGALFQKETGSELWAADASSPDDVWVSGRVFLSKPRRLRALIVHWDGRSWKEVEPPPIFLSDVAVVSSTEVWGIGGDIDQAKIFHWDGKDWAEIDHRDPPGASFATIEAMSSDDVWIVGTKYGAEYAPNTVGTDTLIEHWDGTRWSVMRSPNTTRRGNWLNGVVPLSRSDVWATGYSEDAEGNTTTLTLHWGGRSWSVVPSPSPGKALNVAVGAGTDGAGGVWAGGHYLDDLDGPLQALYMRWDGESWQVVRPPHGDDSQLTVGAFDGVAANDVWAVGSDATGSFLLVHWNGSVWKAARPDLPTESEGADGALRDVIALATDNGWAVGSFQLSRRVGNSDLTENHPVLEHWDGSRWRLVKLPPIAGS
jgi:hypothetical protein